MSHNEISHDEAPRKSLVRELIELRKLWPYLRENKNFVIMAVLLIPIVSLFQMTLPLVTRYVIDDGIATKNISIVTWGSLLFLGLILSEYITRALQSITSGVAIHRMILLLREHLLGHILRLSCRFHDRNLSGRLVTRATSDFDSLSESLNLGVLTSIIDISVLVGSFAGLFILDWRLALCSLLLLPFIGGIVAWFAKALKKAMLVARAKLSILNGFTQECLQSSRTIKLLGANKELNKRNREMTLEYRNKQMTSVVLDASMFSIIDGMSSITIGLLLWLSLTQFDTSNILTAGVMVAFVQYTQQVFEPLKNLGNKIAMLQGAFAAIERIFSILDTEDFIQGEKTTPPLKGQVDFRDVSFSYKGRESSDHLTLKHMDFSMPASSSLAIVGPTGSGKSTLIKLITKLYDGYSGTITIDGHDLRDLDPISLRRQIAIVPQDIVIFSGSIRDNITLGLESISEEDILWATELLGAQRFIKSLPGQLDFVLQEGGVNLSHGQRQLITFARALARRPALVILDEATSSVDPESEEMIQQGIEKILQTQSVIVIAHRLSTIRHCHKILVIKEGEIIESGTHEELRRKSGIYEQLLHDAH